MLRISLTRTGTNPNVNITRLSVGFKVKTFSAKKYFRSTVTATWNYGSDEVMSTYPHVSSIQQQDA